MRNMDSFNNKKQMNSEFMLSALSNLNDKMEILGIKGEVCIFGGAVMCLVLNARGTTHDIDAVFNPKSDISFVVKQVASDLNLSNDWLNDGVKGFVSENNDIELFMVFSNLLIYNASPKYIFAMKCLSCRMDNISEMNDIKFLIGYLKLESIQQAESIIYSYYPKNRVLPKIFYLLEEFFSEKGESNE